MVAALDGVVDEGVGRRDGEDVSLAGVIVDIEGGPVRAVQDLVVAAAAGEVVFPRLTRKQHAYAAIGVDAQDRDVGVLVGAEVDAHGLSGARRIVAAVGPHLDAGAVDTAGRGARGRAVGNGEHAEQA